jgi:hypothetical protein
VNAYRVASTSFLQSPPKGVGGVYRVHCFASEAVARALGEDTNGVPYIGRATLFTARVATLKKSISPDYRGKGHVCGRRYKNEWYAAFARRFPVCRLDVSFKPNADPAAAEAAALEAYARKFGELPPLNRQGRSRRPMNAVILDIDGTLIESSDVDSALYVASMRAVLGEVRLRESWRDYRHVTDSGILYGILEDNGLPRTWTILDAVRDHFVASLSRHIDAHGPFTDVAGARQFVNGLRTLHALKQLGGDFESVTYYGDGEWDAVASRELGWGFVPVGATLGGLKAFGPLIV